MSGNTVRWVHNRSMTFPGKAWLAGIHFEPFLPTVLAPPSISGESSKLLRVNYQLQPDMRFYIQVSSNLVTWDALENQANFQQGVFEAPIEDAPGAKFFRVVTSADP